MTLRLGLGISRRGKRAGSVSYDPDAAALFAAMTVQPSATRKGQINTFILALKSAGSWALLDALWVFAAHDSQAALLNWKNPATFAASLVNAPSFTADRGFLTNGTNGYVLSNFDPVTAAGLYAQNSATFGFRNRTEAQASGQTAGAFDGTDGVAINVRTTTNTYSVRMNQATAVTGASTVAAGLWHLNRSGATAFQVDKDGAAFTSGTTASTALNSLPFRFGSISDTQFSAKEFACGFVGGSHDATQRAAFAAAELAYMQAVGAA